MQARLLNAVEPAIYEDAYQDGVEAAGNSMTWTYFDEYELRSGKKDPFLAANQDPYVFTDGILVPKPMQNSDDWEAMGDVEYRAFYYALCKFNQASRSGIEYKTWGPRPDQTIYKYPDTASYYYASGQVFLEVVTQYIGPTARRARNLQAKQPELMSQILAQITEICGDAHASITVKQFMDISMIWRKHIGVPRDIHAACADFVPGSCNIFQMRRCAVMLEYDRRLAAYSGDPVGSGVPDLPSDPLPQEPRGALLPQAMLFAGGIGSQRMGMLAKVKDLPRVREKLEVAEKLLGYDMLELCINGPAEKLDAMEYNGVAMYMAGWAAYEKFLHDDPENARRCQAAAGIDVGEYVALTVAGVLPFEAGLELAKVRCLAMKEVSEKLSEQAVCSVAGLSEDRVNQLCELALSTSGQEEDVCQITTVLFNKGYVVGGKTKSVETFKSLAEQDGALKVKILPGQIALHSPLTHSMQWAIKSKLREFKHKIRVPWCDVYFNAPSENRLPANGGDNAKEAQEQVFSAVTRLLCEAVWSPCRWDSIMQSTLDNGITKFFECSPNPQLKAIMKRINAEAFKNTSHFTI